MGTVERVGLMGRVWVKLFVFVVGICSAGIAWDVSAVEEISRVWIGQKYPSGRVYLLPLELTGETERSISAPAALRVYPIPENAPRHIMHGFSVQFAQKVGGRVVPQFENMPGAFWEDSLPGCQPEWKANPQYQYLLKEGLVDVFDSIPDHCADLELGEHWLYQSAEIDELSYPVIAMEITSPASIKVDRSVMGTPRKATRPDRKKARQAVKQYKNSWKEAFGVAYKKEDTVMRVTGTIIDAKRLLRFSSSDWPAGRSYQLIYWDSWSIARHKYLNIGIDQIRKKKQTSIPNQITLWQGVM